MNQGFLCAMHRLSRYICGRSEEKRLANIGLFPAVAIGDHGLVERGDTAACEVDLWVLLRHHSALRSNTHIEHALRPMSGFHGRVLRGHKLNFVTSFPPVSCLARGEEKMTTSVSIKLDKISDEMTIDRIHLSYSLAPDYKYSLLQST